jgi:hypothetical protein
LDLGLVDIKTALTLLIRESPRAEELFALGPYPSIKDNKNRVTLAVHGCELLLLLGSITIPIPIQEKNHTDAPLTIAKRLKMQKV